MARLIGPKQETSDAAAKEFGFVRTAANWRDVIDALVVGTRIDAHYEIIPPILESGRHVLSMNAHGRNAVQARELMAAATKRSELRLALLHCPRKMAGQVD